MSALEADCQITLVPCSVVPHCERRPQGCHEGTPLALVDHETPAEDLPKADVLSLSDHGEAANDLYVLPGHQGQLRFAGQFADGGEAHRPHNHFVYDLVSEIELLRSRSDRQARTVRAAVNQALPSIPPAGRAAAGARSQALKQARWDTRCLRS